MAKPPLGEGGRFAALKSKLAGKPGVKNPAALAAAIGRKKYGKKKMGKLSAKGRRDAMEHKAAKGLKRAFPED